MWPAVNMTASEESLDSRGALVLLTGNLEKFLKIFTFPVLFPTPHLVCTHTCSHTHKLSKRNNGCLHFVAFILWTPRQQENVSAVMSQRNLVNYTVTNTPHAATVSTPAFSRQREGCARVCVCFSMLWCHALALRPMDVHFPCEKVCRYNLSSNLSPAELLSFSVWYSVFIFY